MHARHYSPRTRLFVVDSPADLPDRLGAYLWWKHAGLTSRSLRMPSDAGAYAARFYRVLHELDHENWPWIAVEALPQTIAWAALRDRLDRASHKS
jgi:L-threonylcarbamoyladenylate synthase